MGETARVVHVVPLPTDTQAGAVGALCGAALMVHDMETVTPGQGMPCTVCVLTHVTGTGPAEEPGSPADGPGEGAGGDCYQKWGWISRRDQVRLSLDREVSALAIPIPLCIEVTRILTQRRCAPPVLAHPYTPDHHILLTGERYGVTLPRPPQVHRITGVLLLPPTQTPRGPITWIRSPRADSLRLCREIDLFGALRTALSSTGVTTRGAIRESKAGHDLDSAGREQCADQEVVDRLDRIGTHIARHADPEVTVRSVVDRRGHHRARRDAGDDKRVDVAAAQHHLEVRAGEGTGAALCDDDIAGLAAQTGIELDTGRSRGTSSAVNG